MVAAALGADDVLTEDDVELLKRCALPGGGGGGDDDAKELAALDRASRQAARCGGTLRKTDAWCLSVRTSVPRLRARLQVASAKLTAPERLCEAAEQTDRRGAAVEAVKASEGLRDALRVALFAGNTLNHGAKSRLAAGVGVEAGLSKLANVKGAPPHASLSGPREGASSVLQLSSRLSQITRVSQEKRVHLSRDLEER